jgi:putative transposase
VSFGISDGYTNVIGDWKRWITRHHKIGWQENFFEHRIRRDESLGEKAQYILNNPVRAGLVARTEDWSYFWRPA